MAPTDARGSLDGRFAPTPHVPATTRMDHPGHSASHRVDQSVRCIIRPTSRVVAIGIVSLQGRDASRALVSRPTVRRYSSNANKFLRGLAGATPCGRLACTTSLF